MKPRSTANTITICECPEMKLCTYPAGKQNYKVVFFYNGATLYTSFTFAVPWLRRLVTSPSPQRPRFMPRSVHVGFVVDKVALGQVFL
jgi:hypothetical protein